VDPDAVERARRRLSALAGARLDEPTLYAALQRAQEGLETFAQTTAELEATLPERLSEALHTSLQSEVLPVARHVAEVRGLSSQTIRRIERLHAEVEAERRDRVEDLALLVDLTTSGWRSVERRLDRIERLLDRIEQQLEERPRSNSILRLEPQGGGRPAQ
jgi:hypothetical protein